MDDASPILHLALLGPPATRWAERALPIPRRQARALLYRLAAALAPVPRDHLCYLFWPDVADAVARRNLTHLLTLLRRALPRPDLLVADSEALSLHPLLAESDLAGFARLTRTVEAQARAPKPSPLPSNSTVALSLWASAWPTAPSLRPGSTSSASPGSAVSMTCWRR